LRTLSTHDFDLFVQHTIEERQSYFQESQHQIVRLTPFFADKLTSTTLVSCFSDCKLTDCIGKKGRAYCKLKDKFGKSQNSLASEKVLPGHLRKIENTSISHGMEPASFRFKDTEAKSHDDFEIKSVSNDLDMKNT